MFPIFLHPSILSNSFSTIMCVSALEQRFDGLDEGVHVGEEIEHRRFVEDRQGVVISTIARLFGKTRREPTSSESRPVRIK